MKGFFKCKDCLADFYFEDYDPTTSTGVCKICGSNKWNIFDFNDNIIE